MDPSSFCNSRDTFFWRVDSMADYFVGYNWITKLGKKMEWGGLTPPGFLPRVACCLSQRGYLNKLQPRYIFFYTFALQIQPNGNGTQRNTINRKFTSRELLRGGKEFCENAE
jgi:hypothetical protein